MPRRACCAPKRFSISWSFTPQVSERALVTDAVASRVAKAVRLAFHQIAKNVFHAAAFARVVFVADRAGLAAKFEAEERVLQRVEAAFGLRVKIGHRFGLRDGSGAHHG